MASVRQPSTLLAGDLTARARSLWHVRPSFAVLVMLYAAYLVAAKVGAAFSIIPGVDITFWPPAGLMVGMLLVMPRPSWPWLLLVGVLGEFTANALWFQNPLHFTALYAIGNILEVTCGALIYAALAQNPDR